MSYNIGDIVGIGNGRVEYRVTNTHPEKMGDVMVESLNTGKSQLVATTRLRLIRAVETDAVSAAVAAGEVHMSKEWVKEALTDAQIEELDETYAEAGMFAAQKLKAEYLSEFKARPTPYSAYENYEEWNNGHTIPTDPYSAWEIELLAPRAKYALHIDGVTTGYKSYDAACNALIIAKREGFTSAAIDHNGRRIATR